MRELTAEETILRDQFACAAMQAAGAAWQGNMPKEQRKSILLDLAERFGKDESGKSRSLHECIALDSYELADAMLTARRNAFTPPAPSQEDYMKLREALIDLHCLTRLLDSSIFSNAREIIVRAEGAISQSAHLTKDDGHNSR